MTASTLLIVPARGGSKRMPDKNIRPLAGRSLIERTADAIADAGLHDYPCLLSTDDVRIAAEGRRLGWIVPWLRPEELATDSATTIDVVLHALDWWKESNGHDPHFLMLLQVTSPFRRQSDPRDALKLFDGRQDIDAVVGMCDLHRDERSLFRAGPKGYLAPLAANASSGPILTPNGALYVIRSAALRCERTLFPKATLPILMDSIHSIDIDTPSDWLLAEAIAEQRETTTRNK